MRLGIVIGITIVFLSGLESVLEAQTCVTAPANMVSWWPGDGDATDISGASDGIPTNGTTFGAGLVDQAFVFDGIDDFVEIADAPGLDLSSGEFTIDLWVKPKVCSVASGDAIPFLTKESSTQFDAYTIGLGSTGIGFAASSGGSFQTLIAGGACTVGVWQFIAVTQSAGTATLYRNGVFVGVDNTAVVPADTFLPLQLGFREDVSSSPGLQSRFFEGSIDEVELFDRALTQAEIVAIFDAGSAGKCKNPTVPVSSSTWGEMKTLYLR